MSDKLIANAMLTTAACVTLGKLIPAEAGGKGEWPEVRTYIAIGVAFFFLSSINDFSPEIARPLSIAVAGTAFSVYGVPVVTKLLGEDPKETTK